jgi:hypothetical protein
MLYGSIKNDFNIMGYIPRRIELIFTGVVIFTFVELLLFPRSSRKMVEGLGFQFFLCMRDFMKQAVSSTRRMEEYVKESNNSTMYMHALFDESNDQYHLEKLADCHKKLSVQSAKLKKELDSALAEPNVGLALPLHPESFRGLIAEQANCEMQVIMMMDALNKLAGYYQQEGHPIRELNWPHVHKEILEDAACTTDRVCEWLKDVYRDGSIRSQNGNSIKAVAAAASFREFEDVRLRIIATWSSNYQDFIKNNGFKGSDPVAIMTLGITTTHILELCRHMQKAGKHLEEIAYRYPASR